MPIMRIARYPNRNALLRHTFGVHSVNGHVTSVDISCCCCCCWWWWWWWVVVVVVAVAVVVVVVSYKRYWLKSHLISSTNIPTLVRLRTARCLFTQSQWLKQTKNIGHVWKKQKHRRWRYWTNASWQINYSSSRTRNGKEAVLWMIRFIPHFPILRLVATSKFIIFGIVTLVNSQRQLEGLGFTGWANMAMDTIPKYGWFSHSNAHL